MNEPAKGRPGTQAPGGDPELEVVVVSAAGGRDLLRKCLSSLARHPPRCGTVEVWVLDNASNDGTTEMVAREFPDVRLVALPRNLGFSAANNVALRQVRAPQVLLLNPDTEVSPGAVDQALATLHRRADVGVVGVRLVRPDGSFDHAAKRSFPTVVGAVGHFSGVGRRASASGRLAQYRAPALDEFGCGEVDAVCGAFMLVRRAAMETVGLLDDGYHMYGEDLDWCYRFKRGGWKVWYDGTVSVIHVKGGLSVVERGRGRHRGLRTNVAFHLAMARFYRKFHAGRHPLLDGAVYAALGVKLAGSVARSALARRRPT